MEPFHLSHHRTLSAHLIPGRFISVRKDDFHHLVAGGKEEKRGPCKEPEERAVEYPTDPDGDTPLVDEARGVHDESLVLDGELDAEVAAVIRFGDRGAKELLQSLDVVVYDLPSEKKGFDFGGIGHIFLAP